MASLATDFDEPLTPRGRLFLRPEMKQVIHCAIGVENPIDVEAVKSEIEDSVLLKHPRFCSLLVHDRHGVEHWHKTSVNLDHHLIVIDSPISPSAAGNESAVNEYLATLSSGPGLRADKPLWEIHFLMAHRCIVFLVHHALADGTSFMSLLLSVCRKANDLKAVPTVPRFRRSDRRKTTAMAAWAAVVGLVGVLLYGLMFALQFAARLLWVRERKTAILGGDGVERRPRKIATARFCLEDMRTAKRAVCHGNATINDVLCGMISSGLSKYLDHRTPKALQEGLQITGLAMVNLRKQPGLQEPSDLTRSNPQFHWGNNFGYVLLPIQYNKGGADPLQHVRRVKEILGRKKQCMEAHLTSKFCNFMTSYFGPKAAGLFNYKVICNTSFAISNMVGPQEDVAIGDNPVTYIRVNASSLPNALIMHMVSYAGRADMQLLVAKDIIPDPEFLAQCFEDALMEMKEAALATMKNR